MNIVCIGKSGASELINLVRPWPDHFWYWKIPQLKVMRTYLGHTKLMLCFTDYLHSQGDPAGQKK